MVTPRFRLEADMMPASTVGCVEHFPTLVKRVLRVHKGIVSVAWEPGMMLGEGLGFAAVHNGPEGLLVHKGYGGTSLVILKMRHSANQPYSVKHHGAVVLGRARKCNHMGSQQFVHMVTGVVEFDKR